MKCLSWVLTFLLLCVVFIAVVIFTKAKNDKLQMMEMFDDYIVKFNKSYRNSEEYQTRFQHFLASLNDINVLNGDSRGPEQYRARYGLTNLSDMSQAEFQDIHLSDQRSQSGYVDGHPYLPFKYNYGNEPHDNFYLIIRNLIVRKKRSTLPLMVDWRDKGVVGPVREQGVCGACWAFSTAATLESMNAIKNGKLDILSVQQLVDCAGYGNNGCDGGDICLLLNWLYLTNTAVGLEKEYPLEITDGACKAGNTTGVRVRSFSCEDFSDSEDKILDALANHGPVTVAVNALTWQNYLGGVIQYHCSGSPADLNHAVQLIGYDLSADVPHYIAKNSWGPEFGDAGYIKLAIGNNICGLANEVITVDVK